jgi:teichuronic acid biosynthesis glycosyltransferase TuaH
VEYPFTLKDVFTTLLGKQQAPIWRILGLKSRATVKKTEEGALVNNWVLPPMIPLNTIKNDRLYQFILKTDAFLYRWSLRKAIRKLGFSNPIVINAYNPIFGETLSGKLKEKITVYYCYDGFSTDKRGIRAWHADRRFSETADGVIVTSDCLKNQKLQFTHKVVTVKNGVDFEMFNREAKTAVNPGEKRRKIGYIGSIDQRFDIDTVEFSVRHLQDYDFEFIGDVRNEKVKNVLAQFPNVTFLPPIKPMEVPERLKKCDVGIIPYLCNEINKNVYPLKINEYLAVGVPVVVTRFADLPEFSEHVSFASSKEEFRDLLTEVLHSDNSEKIKMRIEFARSNSWKSRADLFSSEVDAFINQNNLKQNRR